MKSHKWHIGIDEAGRGPLAGPVSVGAVMVKSDFDFSIFKNLKDSKKLSESKREEFFEVINKKIKYKVVMVSNKVIDKKGISYAIKFAIKSLLKKLNPNIKNTKIFLDGALKAPEEFMQETIIKGDEKIPAISLASIMAKVTRDRYMKKISNKYPAFNFDIHKGYGTKMHIEAIKKHGPSELHRKSFISRII
ncbi:MAG: ribonuclease HII [bacterium]